jgi:hypothetical protein
MSHHLLVEFFCEEGHGMTKYREVLRMSAGGFSQRVIASTLSISRNTVASTLKRAREQNLDWEAVEQQRLSEKDIANLLFPDRKKESPYQIPDFEYMAKELKKTGVSLQMLWLEYCEGCRSSGKRPYMYSQYCELFRRNMRKNQATMTIPRTPGERVEVDWAGKTGSLKDPVTGDIIPVYIFTYAAGIAMLAGLAMTVGCYQDLVAHAIPADGKWDKKTLFGVPVNPGNYRISPIVGLAIGLFCIGIAIFVTIFFRFSHGWFGLLFVVLAFLAMRDTDERQLPRFRRSMFTGTTSLLRTLLYAVYLILAFALIDIIVRRAGSTYTFTRTATLLSIPLAIVLPEPSTPPSTARRWLTYATLPVFTALVALVKWIVG